MKVERSFFSFYYSPRLNISLNYRADTAPLQKRIVDQNFIK